MEIEEEIKKVKSNKIIIFGQQKGWLEGVYLSQNQEKELAEALTTLFKSYALLQRAEWAKEQEEAEDD